MNWLFWALLFLGVVLLSVPLLGVLQTALAAGLWLTGGVIVIGATIWAVVVLMRNAMLRGPADENPDA